MASDPSSTELEMTASPTNQVDGPERLSADLNYDPKPHASKAVSCEAIDETDEADAPGENENQQTDGDKETAEGNKLFNIFTKDSYQRLLDRELEHKLKEAQKKNSDNEGRLVDGEIVFDDLDNDSEKSSHDPKLADGQPLPEKLGRFPKELEGTPLEEIDANIEEKSFIIVSKKFKKYHIFRFSATRALFCLSPWNPIRRFCLTILSNQWFDWFILLTITVNCIFMLIPKSGPKCIKYETTTDNSTGACIKETDYLNTVPENLFQSIYTVELLIKVCARGLILNKYTYLRDGWNWLDSIVVIIGYVVIIIEAAEFNQSSIDLRPIRAFRVLRALKSISVVPGLRTIVNAFFKSLRMLGEVMLLTLFCIAVFALLALQLYKGLLKQKCVNNIPKTFNFCNSTYPGNGSELCFNSPKTLQTYWLQDEANYRRDPSGEFILCASTDDKISGCPKDSFCVQAGDNPNWNYTHFDQFHWAMLNTLQLVSLDFWEDTYDKIIIVSGPWNIFFFMMVVLLGSFYLLNLILAVVFMAYVQEADVEAKEERAKAKRKENTALLFDPKILKQQLLQKQEEEARKKLEIELAKQSSSNLNDEAGQPLNEYVDANEDSSKTKDTFEEIADVKQDNKSDMSMTQVPPIAVTSPNNFSLPNFSKSPQKSVNIETTDVFQASNNTTVEHGAQKEKATPIKRPTTAHGQFLRTAAMVPEANLRKRENDEVLEVTELEEGYGNSRRNSTCPNETTQEQEQQVSKEDGEDSFYDDLPDIDRKTERYLLQKFATLWLNKIRPEEDKLIDRNCLCCAKSGLPTYHVWMKIQNMVYKVANDGLFELFITLCIACNTCIMASESYYICELCRFCVNATCDLCHKSCNYEVDSQREWVDGMPKVHEQVLSIANVVFTIIFTVEACIKLVAFSKEYFKVGWNIFDLIIVALSLPDVILFSMKNTEANGFQQIAGIIKIFRLLRIVKLAQSWSTMRTLLAIVFDAFGALVNLNLILLIVILIFAVLGHELFGEFYSAYEDLVNNPQLADYEGQLPRWHFHDVTHSLLMVFRVLCGEWVEPLRECMRVAGDGCTFLFITTLLLGNFMIFNLFLALLLNSFSTDKIKRDKVEEGEGKLKKSLKRIYSCFHSCTNKKDSKDNQALSQNLLKVEDDKAIQRLHPDSIDRKLSINVNGSEKSLVSLIEATEPKSHCHRSLSVGSFEDSKSWSERSSYLSNGLELKPAMSNGYSKSRSGSIISSLSNGYANGVLKNKSVEMSPGNLRQIESAFSTHRDDYANFETAVEANTGGCSSMPRSPITPIIITEDYSKEPVTVEEYQEEQFQGETEVNISSTTLDASKENEKTIAKDDEEEMIAEDGKIVLPDCLCPIVHRNSKYNNCCPSTWQNFRITCASIVTHKAFEGLILLLIAASTIALCFEDIHLHAKPTLSSALNYLNIVFALFFFVEMILKIIALGLKKYFTGFWSILDFLIVCVSITDTMGLFFNSIDVTSFRAMRTLRALRPLRAVSRWESMTIIVNALIFALPAIANVFLVCIVFWLIFVIMGVQTFRGKFHQCEIDDLRVKAYATDYHCDSVPIPLNITELRSYHFPLVLSECNSTILSPLLGEDSANWHWAKLCHIMGGIWKRPFIHFDHLGAGYLALFQTATFEGWMEVMDAAIDHNPVMGGQADREQSFSWYIYFVLFITFGAFFTLNLFIGVIIDNFNMLKKKYDGSYLALFLTENQRHYYATLKKLGNKKPQKTIRRPKSKTQAVFFDIATSNRFEIGITIVILLNMASMMVEYEPRTVYGSMSVTGEFVPDSNASSIDHELLTEVLFYINTTFTVIFVVEAAIKIIGLRFHYFRKAWNVFDFVIVLVSTVSLIMDKHLTQGGIISPSLLRVVRVFRIGRVLRLVKAAKGIRKLLFALVISIPALFNIATLLFLFMFIFAIVGMTYFGNVRHRGALTATVNFETFGRSMLLLFRLSTSGGWNDVLYPLMEEDDCNGTHYINTLGVPQNRVGGDCGSQAFAIPFFLCYLFISFMVIINMYIAVILENFNQAHEQEEIGITDDDFDMFYAIWEKYDPHATQYIKLELLSEFIESLDIPLGIPKPNNMAIVAFNLPIVEGDRIHCLDVLMALVKRVLRGTDEDMANKSEQYKEANEKLQQQIAEKYKSAFPYRQQAKVVTTTMQRKKEDVAAKTLQRAWRKHKMKQNILRIRDLAKESTSAHHESASRRLSISLSNIKDRISSALSRLSLRRSSIKSAKSGDSHHL